MAEIKHTVSAVILAEVVIAPKSPFYENYEIECVISKAAVVLSTGVQDRCNQPGQRDCRYRCRNHIGYRVRG